MKDRIILHTTAVELSSEEVELVSGGVTIGPPGGGGWEWGNPYEPGYGGGGGSGVTGPQSTEKASSLDPNGPRDPDTSMADF